MTMEELRSVTMTDDEALSAIDVHINALFNVALIQQDKQQRNVIGRDLFEIMKATLNRWESEV